MFKLYQLWLQYICIAYNSLGSSTEQDVQLRELVQQYETQQEQVNALYKESLALKHVILIADTTHMLLLVMCSIPY